MRYDEGGRKGVGSGRRKYLRSGGGLATRFSGLLGESVVEYLEDRFPID